MFDPKWRIIVKTDQGKVFEAFTWCFDPDRGCNRAKKEGSLFGYTIVEAWAIPIMEGGE